MLADAAPVSTVPADAAPASTVPASKGESSPAPAGSQRAIDAARLRVAVLRLSRRLRKHDLAGLTPSQLSTLATIGQYGPVRLGDLAAAERIAPSTLTRLISVLEGLGYVRREANQNGTELTLQTAEGESLVKIVPLPFIK